jgi:hypothetical protein
MSDHQLLKKDYALWRWLITPEERINGKVEKISLGGAYTLHLALLGKRFVKIRKS